MLGTMSTPAREAVDHACGCKPGRTCDGLECLCRPRFFAGQLLTDDDLRRLDHYIVAKNRLHNRYLHGTGVVCGLEVVCSACDDTVTVRPGFAIGPCGEDIVVCKDTSVDVGELIRECRRQRTKAECEPYGGRPADDCEAARQRWILAICYDERPSRGVASLRPSQTVTCGCSCGGCGGGNGNGNGHGGAHRDDACSCRPSGRRSTPPQCEPTVTCEGYRFVVLKEPPRRVTDPKLGSASGGLTGLGGGLADSELGRRVQACLFDITARMRQLGKARGTADLVELCCDLKDELRDIIATSAVHDCMLGGRLGDVVCPDSDDQDAQQRATQAIQQLLLIAIELFKSCICSALLPPCPVESPDDCIPLATLTVRTADLRVLDICNWTPRRFAVTFPTLGYWLGWLPIWDTLRAAVTSLCCGPVQTRFAVTGDANVRYVAVDRREPVMRGPAAAAPEEAAAAGERVGPRPEGGAEAETRMPAFTRLATRYALEATPLSGLEATLLGALGARADDGTELASDLELQEPLAALALSRLAGPALAPLVPEQFTAGLAQVLRRGVPSEAAVTEPSEAAESGAERMARMEEALADLRKKVGSQSRTITNLRKKLDNR